MASNDRINLVEEFSKLKNNQYIILTSFNFDPYFFDSFLLPVLEKHNRTAQIVVLVDEGQYNLSYPRFTNRTGVDYHLIPIRLKNGVFHPKFFLFASKDAITTLIGSSNLSLQGFTNNAELVLKNSVKRSDGISKNAKTILTVLKKFVSQQIIHDEQVIQIIKRLGDDLDSLHEISDEGFQVVHNLDEPILNQLFTKIPEKEFNELFVLSPFISNDGKPLEEILNQFAIKSVKIALQKRNHNLNNIKQIEKIVSEKNSNLVLLSASFRDSLTKENEVAVPRRFHSKIVMLQNSSSTYLLVGSPNFTTQALSNTVLNGNFELGILWKNPQFDVLNEIKLQQSTNSDELLSNTRNGFEILPSFLSIHSVNFDLMKRKLTIKTEPIMETFETKIRTKEPKTILTENIDFTNGIVEIPIPEGKPVEFEVNSNGKSIQRRIFDDSDPVKRLFRSGFSIRTLTENIEEMLKLDRYALLEIIQQISDVTMKPFQISTEETKTRDSTHQYFPSLERIPKHFGNTINSLANLVESIETERETLDRDEEVGTENDYEELATEQFKESVIKRVSTDTKLKLLNKFINRLYLVLAHYKQKNIEENLTGIIATFLLTFIQFVPYIWQNESSNIDFKTLSIDNSFNEINNNFLLKLDEMLKNISMKEMVTANYQNLLVVSIFFTMITSKVIRNDNLRLCFVVHDFFAKNQYDKIREYSKNYFLRLNQNFNLETFNSSYASYAYQVMQTEISDETNKLIKVMEKEEEENFLTYLKLLLSQVYKNYSESTFKDMKYDRTTKGGKIVYDILGDYEDPNEWMDHFWE